MAGNNNLALHAANVAKEDEFYTKLTDIEKECSHYKEYFEDKIIFLNCDDPETSNFWKYFYLNFKHLKLKKLISTHYDAIEPTYKLEYDGTNVTKTKLSQNGDFRSPECIDILNHSDIVVTNPPFSLFREYVPILINSGKKFIIIGNLNAIHYKELFPYFKNNEMWLGYHTGDMEFVVPDYFEPRATRYREENGVKYRSMGNVSWYTNLDTKKRHEELILYKTYTPEEYPSFDNFDAINVGKVVEIPVDYTGYMAVPITFMQKYNPEQFEIIDALNRYAVLDSQGTNEKVAAMHSHTCNINGKSTYSRIIIRRIQ